MTNTTLTVDFALIWLNFDFQRAPRTLENGEEVERKVVACDGGGGPLGHPRVWLNMEGKGQVDCPYCDKRFILKAGAGGGGHH